MIKSIIALVSTAFLSLGSPLLAAPQGGAGRYAGPPGGAAGPGYAPGRPGWGGGYYGGARPVYGRYPGYGYGGWRGGYWGPRVGYHYGGPGYWGWPGVWGGWPGAWGTWGAGYGYGVGYSVAPTVVYEASQPQVFIQQEPAPAAAPQVTTDAAYWYYCTEPAGYFPYVKECSQPWLKVVPQVPGQQSVAPRVAP